METAGTTTDLERKIATSVPEKKARRASSPLPEPLAKELSRALKSGNAEAVSAVLRGIDASSFDPGRAVSEVVRAPKFRGRDPDLVALLSSSFAGWDMWPSDALEWIVDSPKTVSLLVESGLLSPEDRVFDGFCRDLTVFEAALRNPRVQREDFSVVRELMRAGHAFPAGAAEAVLDEAALAKLMKLVEKDRVVTEKKRSVLIEAAKVAKDARALGLAVETGGSISERDASGRTPLHWAAANGNAQTVGFLLEAGADVSVKDVHGLTPIGFLATKQFPSMSSAKRLVAGGARVGVEDLARLTRKFGADELCASGVLSSEDARTVFVHAEKNGDVRSLGLFLGQIECEDVPGDLIAEIVSFADDLPTEWRSWLPEEKLHELRIRVETAGFEVRDLAAERIANAAFVALPEGSEILPAERKQRASLYRSVEGWFDFARIYMAAVDLAPIDSRSVFVEIGCWFGASTCFMGEEVVASGKDIVVWGIDAWDLALSIGKENEILGKAAQAAPGNDVYAQCVRNLRSVKADGAVRLLNMRSDRAATLFADGSVDFVFVDGAHDYASVKTDLRVWLPKVKVGGLIGGHDVDEHGVQNAGRDVLGIDLGEARITSRSWLLKRLV